MLGKLSYSIYLVQFPIIGSLSDGGVYRVIGASFPGRTEGYLIAAALTLALTIAASFVTYNLIEEPGRRFLVGLTKKDKVDSVQAVMTR